MRADQFTLREPATRRQDPDRDVECGLEQSLALGSVELVDPAGSIAPDPYVDAKRDRKAVREEPAVGAERDEGHPMGAERMGSEKGLEPDGPRRVAVHVLAW